MKTYFKVIFLSLMIVPCKLSAADDSGYRGNYDLLDPNLNENFKGKPGFRQVDNFRRRLDAETVKASSHNIIGVSHSTYPKLPEYAPEAVGDMVVGTGTFGIYYATCSGNAACWKLIPGTTQALFTGGTVSGGGCDGDVTIPTGTIAVFCLNEGSGLNVAEVNYSTRIGVLAGDSTAINWISTAGARGMAAPSTRPTTGYISIPGEPWQSLHAGGASVGQQTIMMCIEPRQGGINGYWSKEDNSGTKYAYVIFQQVDNTVSSRLSTSVGAGVSTFVSSANVINLGQRNSIVARIDKTQTLALSNRMFVNGNLMSGDATGILATTTDPDVDLRFGLQGSDPTGSFSDSNMSFFIYLERNVTQAEINTYHADCAAFTP